MDRKSCFHGRFLCPQIEFMHTTEMSCLEALEFFRAAKGIWEKICQCYGEVPQDFLFWVIIDYSPANPVIASCCQNGIYLNLAVERTNLSPAQDVSSRLIEELYQLHEWRVRGVVPDYKPAENEKFGLEGKELLRYYALPHKRRALNALCEMTNIPYWKEFRTKVDAYLEGA